MKKTITAVAVLTLSATLAFAGPGKGEGKRGGHGRHGRGAEFGARFAEKLNLTEAQKAQVKSLSESFRTQNAPLFEQKRQLRTDMKAARQANDTARLETLKGSAESLHAQLRAARQAHRNAVLQVLTADQRAQLEAWKATRKSRKQ
jgi:periplasmic protein CpxP/Spy